MNKITFSLLAGLLLAGALADKSLAQAVAPAGQKPTVNTNALTPRPAIRDRADYWAQRLSLSDEQKQKVKPIFDEQLQKMTELRKRTELKPEERRAKVTAIQDEVNGKLKPILTPEQWEKYIKPYTLRTNASMMRLTNKPPVAVPTIPAK
jgi:Spy/CpxP family protein refolding chaperone